MRVDGDVVFAGGCCWAVVVGCVVGHGVGEGGGGGVVCCCYGGGLGEGADDGWEGGSYSILSQCPDQDERWRERMKYTSS